MTAIAVPLPIKKMVVNLSQSNGSTVAEAKTFEDANPQIALRNPIATGLSVLRNQGSVRDEILMPDPEFGQYRTVNYRGKGSLNVRYLTFFNPTSTCVELADASIAMPTYPGELEVASVENATTLTTAMRWQNDPSGVVTLTRKLNRAVHTIGSAPTIPGQQLVVNERFDPPLEPGERFEYTLAAAVVGGPTSFQLYNQFGGNHDIGGKFEASLDGVYADYPNTTVNGHVSSVWAVSFLNGTPGVVDCQEHAVFLGRKIRFVLRGAGTLPSPLVTTSDYYITRIDPNTPTRFYISLTATGAEIAFATNSTDVLMSFMPDGRDSTLAGMNIRCLSGTNAGEVRPLGDMILFSGKWSVFLTEGFTNFPGVNDTFQIEPPDVGGIPVPFDKWAYFLPVCQYNGREQGLPAALPVTMTTGAATGVFIANDASAPFPAVPLYDGCPVRFYTKVYSDAAGTTSGQVWPTGLTVGRVYYVVGSNETTGVFDVSATYDGPPIALTGTSGQVHWVESAETWLQNDNPAPPGFNFKNQRCIPVSYQPYRGASFDITPLLNQPKIAYHWGLAQRLSEAMGEDIYVIDLAVGGSTLSQVAVPPANPGSGVGWWDAASMNHWAPGPAALWQRFLDILDAAEITAAREGVQLQAVAVVFPQGESDAVQADRAARYYANLMSFKLRVRAELKRRGMWAREASSLPFLQPLIRTSTTGAWPYSAVVNAAAVRSARADPFGFAWSTDSYTLTDPVHYSGVSMDAMARTAAERILLSVRDEDVVLRICQLALKMAGEFSDIVSIYPPDVSSKEAALCAAFYPEARDHMLERHAWDFIVRNEELAETVTSRTDWLHAYLLPDNFGGMIGLGEDIMSAFDSRAAKFKFSVELDENSDRVLYANQPAPVFARYKVKTVDPAKFTSSFVNATAAFLASMVMRTTMKGEEGIKAGQALEARAYLMFRDAASVDANTTRDSSQPQAYGWSR
jgi:hypothetical protein